jgi:hypothetical protein
MLEFFIDNIIFMVTAACAVAVCVWLARKGQLSKVRQIILSLCVNAELTYGSGTGEIKKSSVIEALYGLLPSWAKLFISDTVLSKLVEEGKADMDKLVCGNAKVMKLLYSALSGSDGNK